MFWSAIHGLLQSKKPHIGNMLIYNNLRIGPA